MLAAFGANPKQRVLTVQLIFVIISASKICDVISGGGNIKVAVAGDMFTKQRDDKSQRGYDLHLHSQFLYLYLDLFELLDRAF